MFGRLLGWNTIHTFWGLLPLTEFCQVHNYFASKSCVLYWQHQPNFVVWYKEWNGIAELSLLVIFNGGRHLYSEGGYHVGHRRTF